MLTVTIDQSEGISGADIQEQAVKKNAYRLGRPVSTVLSEYGFTYIRVGKVKLSHFPSRTRFGTLQVRGKQRTDFLRSGWDKLSYSIFHLLLHSARSRLGVNSVQF